MQSDVKGPRSQSREIIGLKGLYTMSEDNRGIPDGFCSVAQDVVFDKKGNCRPKDGSSAWWPAISQRQYLSEARPAESWTGGAQDYVDFEFGYSSRYIQAAGTTNMDQVFATTIDAFIGGSYVAANAHFTMWVKLHTPSDITAATVKLSSGADFTGSTYVATINAGLLAQLQALTPDTWTKVTWGISSFTGAANFAALTRMRITLTCTAGAKAAFDEIYIDFTDYDKSYALGGMEYERITDGARFTVAAFGETVYADLNGAKAPYKVLSQLTRNKPLYMDVARDRLALFNGVDPGFIFTGNSVRNIGFPAPVGPWAPGFTYDNAGGSLTPGDQFYYGVTFVYGENGVEFGQSSMLVGSAQATVAGGKTEVLLANIPVGPPGSGVIARRIWRTRQGAAADATQYLITELLNNTVTTYADGALDIAIITAQTAPINNGIPPVSIMAVWFQKAMVYVTNRTVVYSRVGIDINSDMEIVPAENILVYGQSGPLVGAVEFNGVLYLFSKRGITALFWQGSVLLDRPVQRTAETRAQNVGAYDGRSITVVQNRYLRWQDAAGQVWKMWPNEQIDPESQHLANLLDNFNRLPLAGSLEHWGAEGQANFNAGTVGDNLTTAENVGLLQYKDKTATRSAFITGIAPSTPLVPPTRVVQSPTFAIDSTITDGNPQNQFGNAYWINTGDVRYITLQLGSTNVDAGLGVVRIAQLQLKALLGFAESQLQTPTYTWAMYKANYTTPTVLGALLDSGSCVVTNLGYGGLPGAPTWTAYDIRIPLASGVHLPAGEYVTLAVTLGPWVTPPNQFVGCPFLAYTLTTPGADGDITARIAAGTVQPPYSIIIQPNVTVTGGVWTNGKASGAGFVQSSQPQGGDLLQRWWKFSPGADINLRAAKRIQVNTTATSSGSLNPIGPFTVYQKDYVGAGVSIEPTSIEAFSVFPIPDYRPAAAYPAFDYTGPIDIDIEFTFPTWDQAAVPSTNGQSRVSTTQADTVPQVIDPQMMYSKEASFAGSYNPADYLNDIWTGPAVLMPNGVSSFGRFAAAYVENQQLLTFQIRSAVDQTALASATWHTVPTNVDLSAYYTPGTTDKYFQLRIIFQDNPLAAVSPTAPNPGQASYVTSVKLAWASGGTLVFPVMPPVMYYYKDYTYMSWASRGARLSDHSLAVDDFSDNGMTQYSNGENSNRWSSFSAIHYGCYMVVGGFLIGGPTRGGQLVLLRQSATTEYTGAPITGIVVTQPSSLGTPFLKTIDYSYVGMILNIHQGGFFQGQPDSWPAAVITPTSFPYPHILFFISGSTKSGQVGSFQVPLNQEVSFDQTETTILAGSPGVPFQPEYGTDVAIQERAVQLRLFMSPFLDAAGVAYFPTFTNVGFEWYTENYRGV